MNAVDPRRLGARERAILEAVYALGTASASDVVEFLEDEEGYDSIRVTLGKLARRGALQRTRDGRQYVYRPALAHEKARRPAMSHLIETFFAGSTSSAVLAFLDMSRDKLSPDDLDEIAAWIDQHSPQD